MEPLGCDPLRWSDIEAELLKFLGKAVGEALLVSALEVVGSEVAIVDAFLEHDVDGGEHGSGRGDDGLLGAAGGLSLRNSACG